MREADRNQSAAHCAHLALPSSEIRQIRNDGRDRRWQWRLLMLGTPAQEQLPVARVTGAGFCGFSFAHGSFAHLDVNIDWSRQRSRSNKLSAHNSFYV